METQISLALEEWRSFIDQLRGGRRPKLNFQLKQKYAGVLSSILEGGDSSLVEVFPNFAILPSGVVGLALGRAYSNLSQDGRTQVLSWISRHEQDRRDLECTYALPGMMRTASEDAFACLSGMRTGPPPAPTKELRERLAVTLVDTETTLFKALFNPGQEEFKVRKVVRLLLLVADDPRAEQRLRAAILLGTLPTITERRMHVGGENCREQVRALMSRLDSHTAERITQKLPAEMQNGKPILPNTENQVTKPRASDVPKSPLLTSSPGCEPSQLQHTVIPPISLVASAKSPIEQDPDPTADSNGSLQPVTMATLAPIPVIPDPLTWFDANIQMLAHAKHFYADARQRYEHEKQRREELETHLQSQSDIQAALSAALIQVDELQNNLAQLTARQEAFQKEREFLKLELENEKKAKASLESSMQVLQEKAQISGHEREELSLRIDDHAEKVLSDFRVALSSAISPLVKDLPENGASYLNELAPNLLIIIRQIIDALSDRGVEVRRTAGPAK